MTRTQHILCPVDFSSAAATALQYAMQLAESVGAKVTVLHVHQISPYALSESVYFPTGQWAGKLAENSRSDFERWVSTYKNDSPVNVTLKWLQGTPHIEIVSIAAQLSADLLVMGTHGYRGFSRFLMGSVADRVVRTVELPVITVHAAEDSNTPLPSPKRILIATDFSDASEKALQFAHSIQPNLGAKLDVVHVYSNPFEIYKDIPLDELKGSSPQFEAYLIGMRQLLDKSAERCLGELAQSEHVHTHTFEGIPSEKILEVAKQLDSDLICVGAIGKSAVQRALLGSVTQTLIRTSEIPVLTVH